MTAASDRSISEVLRVRIVQHGGFAGVPIVCEMDTGSMVPRRARKLRALVHASGLLDGTSEIVARRSPQGRDLIEWEITVTFGGSSQNSRWTEDALGPALGRLVAFVRG